MMNTGQPEAFPLLSSLELSQREVICMFSYLKKFHLVIMFKMYDINFWFIQYN